jgi:Mg2+/Co2+ transporter CorB
MSDDDSAYLERLSALPSTSKKNRKLRKQARAIIGIRRHPNFFLCCLLIDQVLLDVAIANLFQSLFCSYSMSLMVSTFSIVILGEVLPQTLIPPFALSFSYHCRYFILSLLILTSIPGGLLAIFPHYILRAVAKKQKIENTDLILRNVDLLSLIGSNRMSQGNGGQLHDHTANWAVRLVEAQTETVTHLGSSLDSVKMVGWDEVVTENMINEVASWGFSRIAVYWVDTGRKPVGNRNPRRNHGALSHKETQRSDPDAVSGDWSVMGIRIVAYLESKVSLSHEL